MNVPFDPVWLTGPASTVFALFIVGYFIRQDYNRRNDLDRADRQSERDDARKERENAQQLHQTTINNMVKSHQEVVEKIVSKFEETERLAERRYELVLTKRLNEKGEPIL